MAVLPKESLDIAGSNQRIQGTVISRNIQNMLCMRSQKRIGSSLGGGGVRVAVHAISSARIVLLTGSLVEELGSFLVF